jgi:hypothetical protein
MSVKRKTNVFVVLICLFVAFLSAERSDIDVMMHEERIVSSMMTGSAPLTVDNTKFLYSHYLTEFGLKSSFAFLFKNSSTIEQRMKIFQENIAKMIDFNIENNSSYRQGINVFSGLTFEEFDQFYLSKAKTPKPMEIMKARVGK